MKKGIDVSAWQGEIEWAQVAHHVDYAIIRAYCGGTDPRYADNYRLATSAGLPVGAYLYSFATSPEAAAAEAVAFIKLLQGKQFAYPVYFDMEEKAQLALAKARVQATAKAFCDVMEEAGYFVGLYSYKSFLEANFTPDFLRRYAVWVAHTGVGKTDYAHPFGIWQYSHTGRVSGVSGAVDLDEAYIDYPTQIAAAGKNGFAVTPAPTPLVDTAMCPYPAPTRPQRRGCNGDDVRWVQWQLIRRGYSCGSTGIDGAFGAYTMDAVLRYQRDHRLEVDGVCGPATRASLLNR